MKYYGKISHDKDLITKKYMEDNALQPSDVVDNTSSTATNAPLSANQGKILSDKITNLSNIGRFLSVWNCETGVPTSEPPGLVSGQTYAYKTGDYFRVGTAGYRVPTSDGYTVGGTNYETITELVNVGDVYYYDGTSWMKQASSGGGTVQDVTVDGTSVLSGGIAAIDLATPLGTKQDKLTSANAGDNITITQGSGGRGLPSGYTELSYIESDGTQYINLQKQNTVTSKFYLKTMVTGEMSAMSCVIGANSSTNENMVFYLGQDGTTFKHYFGNFSVAVGNPINQLLEITANYVAKALQVNSNTYTSTTQPTVKNLYLFGSIGSSGSTTIDKYTSQRVYAFKYWDNGTLTMDLVPAKNSFNELGMYDLVNNQFYINAGTGTFIAGAEITDTTKINALSGLTATVTELNTLDGITATTSELNTLHGTTEYTAAEIDTLWESIT